MCVYLYTDCFVYVGRAFFCFPSSLACACKEQEFPSGFVGDRYGGWDSLLNSIQNLPNASSRSLRVWVIGAKTWPFLKTASAQTRT
jgi:hypothetical protein